MGPIWYVVPPGGYGASGPLTTPQLHAQMAAGQVSDAARLHTEDGCVTTLGAVRRWWDQSRGGQLAPMAEMEGVAVQAGPSGVSVSWPWRRGRPWLLFATGFLVLMATVSGGISLAMGDVGASELGLFALLIVAAYGSLAYLVNRTTLTVDGDALVIRHGPLPAWRTGARIELAGVTELFVEGGGRYWRLRAKRWQAPTVTVLATKDAGDAVAAARAIAGAIRQRGYQPMVSESPQQRVAYLLGWASPQATTLEQTPPPEVVAPAGAATAPQPTDGIEVDRTGGGIVIARRWRSAFAVVAFLIWIVFAILLPLAPFLDGKPYEPRHLAAIPLMLISGYAPLALMFNRTRWELKGTTLTIRHRPFPWPGGRTIDLSGAMQIYCKDTTGYRNPYCNLEVLRAGGGSTLLWRFNVNLVPDDHVVAIERNLEHALGIVDQPVAGEVQRNEGRR